MDPITQQPLQQTPPQQTPPSQAPITAAPGHKNVGPIVAVLVIVLVLIIGALYVFASRMNQQTPTDGTNTRQDMAASQSTEVQPVTNKADDVSSIEADLNASTNGLDSQNF